MFFSEAEKTQIIEAIKAAEKETSGEEKVHIEDHCPHENPLKRAEEVFFLLALDNTAQRNGVLFYLSIKDRKFAILGDSGIDKKVGANFWESEKQLLLKHFKVGEVTEGLCRAIKEAGHSLKTHFPYQSGDINELSDDISFG